MKKSLKKYYYTSRFEKYQNDIKKSWNVLKAITGREKSSKSSTGIRMITDCREIFDPE